jgi:hypothetical protein
MGPQVAEGKEKILLIFQSSCSTIHDTQWQQKWQNNSDKQKIFSKNG